MPVAGILSFLKASFTHDNIKRNGLQDSYTHEIYLTIRNKGNNGVLIKCVVGASEMESSALML